MREKAADLPIPQVESGNGSAPLRVTYIYRTKADVVRTPERSHASKMRARASRSSPRIRKTDCANMRAICRMPCPGFDALFRKLHRRRASADPVVDLGKNTTP